MPDQLMRVCLDCHWQARTRLLVCHCGGRLVCRAQGLKVCRMCRAQFDAGANARNTQRCPACVARQPRVQNLRRTCGACGYVYKGLLTVCPCGGQMLSASERDRTCPTCRRAFRSAIRQVYCADCTPADTLKKRAERAELEDLRESPPPPPRAYPCSRCRWGKASTVAASGWECSIYMAQRCQPWAQATMMEER